VALRWLALETATRLSPSNTGLARASPSDWA
jgi:hypothetical protein